MNQYQNILAQKQVPFTRMFIHRRVMHFHMKNVAGTQISILYWTFQCSDERKKKLESKLTAKMLKTYSACCPSFFYKHLWLCSYSHLQEVSLNINCMRENKNEIRLVEVTEVAGSVSIYFLCEVRNITRITGLSVPL